MIVRTGITGSMNRFPASIDNYLKRHFITSTGDSSMNSDNQKGAVLVEAAIILPILFLLVFGIFEFGRAMYITNTLNNAAREGARKAAVMTKPINVDAQVANCIPFDKTGITINTDPASPASGEPVTITVTLPFKTFTEMFPMLDGKILRGVATMRYEL